MSAELPDACPCGDPLDLHIGGKPCVFSQRTTPARTLRDLDVFDWAWTGDAKETGA